ncbi:MAG: DUF4258 domain-containing protein [Candidatus Geothermarchaeales archaeon]
MVKDEVVLFLRLKYTKHALKIMKERGITDEEIIRVVSKPMALYYDLYSKVQVALRKFDDKHLLVVFIRQDGYVKVVTTFKTSAGEEIMRRKEESGLG